MREDGWHRVGQPDLVAAGLDPAVDPRTLRLYTAGREVPILVTGRSGKRFAPGDAVEFYGTGLDTPWTDTRFYWLVAGGEAGLRLHETRGAGGRPAGASFSFTTELKERLVYFAALRNGEKENFFGAVVTEAEPVEQRLAVPHPDNEAQEPAFLEVTLQGASAGRHRVAVAAGSELLYRLNLGPRLVTYFGHGSTGTWNGNILNDGSGAALANGTALPLFVNMTCLNGSFQTPYQDSLAEALLKAPDGGAVAVWASSGLTEPEGQQIMSREFFRLLFGEEEMTVGEAARRAKEAVGDSDVRRTWILFGDPLTTLR